MVTINISEANRTLRFPESISCQIDPKVQLRLLKKRDIHPLYASVGDDREGWANFTGVNVTDANSLGELISFYTDANFILPYVIETTDTKQPRIIGLASIDFFYKQDLKRRGELGVSYIFSKKFRGVGYLEAVTHVLLKTLLDRGVTPVRLVNPSNRRSWNACKLTSRLDRYKDVGEGQKMGVFIVTQREWPVVEKQLHELYRDKVTRKC